MKRLYLTFITALFLCTIAYAKDINVGGFHYRILNDKEVDVIGAEVNDTVASAVCFTDNVAGDYIMLDGKRFIITDPTYIGASVGNAMPDMDNAQASVILLN